MNVYPLGDLCTYIPPFAGIYPDSPKRGDLGVYSPKRGNLGGGGDLGVDLREIVKWTEK